MYRPRQFPARELDDQEIEERQLEMFQDELEKMGAELFFEALTESDRWEELGELVKKGDMTEYYALTIGILALYLTPDREEAIKSIRYQDKYGERLQNGESP